MALAVPLAERVAQLARAGSAAREGHDLPVPEAARQASAAALDRGETHYTDRPGILPLRQRLAHALSARFPVAIDPDGVVITCGVTEARFVAVQQLVPVAGRVVALDHPERIAGACVVRGASCVGPEQADGAVDAVYLGSAANPDARQQWLARALEQNLAVIYEPDDHDMNHPQTAGVAALTVTIGSLGNDQGLEGWRIGYLAAPVERAGPLRDFKQALTLCTTNLSQWGTLALLEAQS